jgi:glycine oxidase
MYDYIIVGQGLAGTLLAHFLMAEGKKIALIDNDTEGGASRIAAGLINPVTGRRIVKSWRIDDILPFAKKTYQSIENQYLISLWQDINIVRTLKNAEDENEWQMRRTWQGYSDYCLEKADPSVFESYIQDFYGYGEITQSAQVDIPFLIHFFKNYFIQNSLYFKEKLDYNALIFKENHVFYKEIQASKIIFCEGAQGALNPYFQYLPFNLDKGELLIIRVFKTKSFNKVFKNNVSIVPLKTENTYWVGATNEWNSTHDKPTESKKQLIINELRDILKCDFEILDHQAAIRPTVRHRRPMIGFHPQYPQMAIFNGFGTKGASLIPYWANHFKDVLLYNTPLEKDVNIDVFAKKM